MYINKFKAWQSHSSQPPFGMIGFPAQITMNSAKIFVCTCEQCRYVKNKRKNRKSKKIIKRLMNKRLRKSDIGKVFNYYWA